MLDRKQIEILFGSLSDDVYELCDAIGFLNALQYKRNTTAFPPDISTPSQGLYHLTLRFAHVSFFIAAGRLMDSDDKKSYSLAYATRQLNLYTPDFEHLSDIWRFKPENWSQCSPKASPTQEQLDTELKWYQSNVQHCLDEFIKLQEVYKPIKMMRDKYYAHTDRRHANKEDQLSLPIESVDAFVEELKKIFDYISGLFRGGGYAFNLDQGKDAAVEMLWLKRNERMDFGISILARNSEEVTDQVLREFVVDYYKRNEPFQHEPHKSVLADLQASCDKRRRARKERFKK